MSNNTVIVQIPYVYQADCLKPRARKTRVFNVLDFLDVELPVEAFNPIAVIKEGHTINMLQGSSDGKILFPCANNFLYIMKLSEEETQLLQQMSFDTAHLSSSESLSLDNLMHYKDMMTGLMNSSQTADGQYRRDENYAQIFDKIQKINNLLSIRVSLNKADFIDSINDVKQVVSSTQSTVISKIQDRMKHLYVVDGKIYDDSTVFDTAISIDIDKNKKEWVTIDEYRLYQSKYKSFPLYNLNAYGDYALSKPVSIYLVNPEFVRNNYDFEHSVKNMLDNLVTISKGLMTLSYGDSYHEMKNHVDFLMTLTPDIDTIHDIIAMTSEKGKNIQASFTDKEKKQNYLNHIDILTGFLQRELSIMNKHALIDTYHSNSSLDQYPGTRKATVLCEGWEHKVSPSSHKAMTL